MSIKGQEIAGPWRVALSKEVFHGIFWYHWQRYSSHEILDWVLGEFPDIKAHVAGLEASPTGRLEYSGGRSNI